jgi:hypothetical protein
VVSSKDRPLSSSALQFAPCTRISNN